MISKEIEQIIIDAIKGERKITFLVGAGLSAESGIPTFRGKDGFWTDGSRNYTPQEIGTKKMFDVAFDQVWRWFLYRISICNKAVPNQGHIELSKIENLIPDRFSLISQNVDGLHFRKETNTQNVFLIHGDLRFMRCSEECTKNVFPIPTAIIEKDRDRNTPFTYDESLLLVCPNCGEPTRPHVLWFDEYYNEHHYHLHKVLKIAKDTGLLFIIGTSGATNLPQKIVENTLKRQGAVIDINPNDNLFTKKIDQLKNGYRVQENSSATLTAIRKIIEKNV